MLGCSAGALWGAQVDDAADVHGPEEPEHSGRAGADGKLLPFAARQGMDATQALSGQAPMLSLAAETQLACYAADANDADEERVEQLVLECSDPVQQAGSPAVERPTITDTTDLDTVWQPQLTGEEGQAPDPASQMEVTSPQVHASGGAIFAGPLPGNPTGDHLHGPSQASGLRSGLLAAAQQGWAADDSDETVASTPSDLEVGGSEPPGQQLQDKEAIQHPPAAEHEPPSVMQLMGAPAVCLQCRMHMLHSMACQTITHPLCVPAMGYGLSTLTLVKM